MKGRNYNLILFCLFVAILDSCSSASNADLKQGTGTSFREVSEVSFPLDSLTTFSQNSIQYREEEGKRHLSLFNDVANSIYEYDYDSRELSRKIHFEKEGPNGIGPNYKTGHLIVARDSVYLLNYLTKELYLADFSGHILHKYILAAKDETTEPNVQLDTRYRAYKIGQYIYFSGANYYSQQDHSKIANCVVLDLVTGQKTEHFPRPEIYNRGNWGYFKYIVYQCYNPKTRKLIFSFGVSDSLFETDLSFKSTNAYLAKSEFFNEIKPLTTNLNEPILEDKIDEYDMTTPTYGSVIFDESANLYYRFVFHPISIEDYKSGDRQRQKAKTSIIVLDSEFRPIDEVILPVDEYLITMFFVSHEGLHLAKPGKYKENEDLLTFGIFKLQDHE